MAKAKKSIAERLKNIDAIANGINNKAQKTIIGRVGANEEISEMLNVEFIPTPSLNLNESIGGGWPRGNISILSGMPDSGKTFLMLETIALNMEKDPNFIALWLESESSLKNKTLDMLGIDRNRFIVIEHDREGAGEEAVNRLEALIHEVDIAVINSLKCLVPSEEFKKDMNSLQVGAQSRMNAKMVRKLTSVVDENNVALIIIQHLTTQIGVMHGDPMTLAGGQAIRHASMLTLELRKVSILDSDPIKKEEGIKINATVKKNHIITDRYPYVKTTYYGIYGQGTEKYLEALMLAIEQGILVKSGAFIKLLDENGEVAIIDGQKMQWQGNSKFRTYCIENPEFFNSLLAEISGEVEQLSEEEVKIIEDENKKSSKKKK